MKGTITTLLLSACMSMTTVSAFSSSLPDSLLTIDNIYYYTFSDYNKAIQIARMIRQRKMSEPYKLDIAEGDLYFNNGKYYQALKYYGRAIESDSVKANDEASMKLMHRFISCYDGLHNEAKKAQYIEQLLQKAQAVGDPVMESIALFNMGKMVYDQKDKKRGYRLIYEAIDLMENSNYEYRKDNLIYDYNTLYIMQQKEEKYEEALETLDKLGYVIAETSDEEFNIQGINKKELKTMYAHRAFILSKLNRKQEATEAYNKWKEIGHINDKDNYLIISYLMTIGEYDEVIRINKIRENFLQQHNDTINYHMVTMKRTTARAYEAKRDYEKSSQYFYQLAVLTDSLKTREQQSAALELATVYETMEKESELQQKNVRLNLHKYLLISALLVILLLAIILWRNMHYARIISQKNKLMAKTVNQLILYKEEKRENKNFVPEEEDQPETLCLSNKALFEKLDNMIVSRQLYLERNLTREDLMKLIGVEKNRFGQILKQENQTSITGYINNLRLESAIKILKENPEISISEVAEKCAIPNISTFYRLFKDKYGMTPVEFRDASKNNQ